MNYLGVGVTWAASTVLFLYLGSLLDRRLGSSPFLSLLGALVGIVAGFYYLIRLVQREAGRRRRRNGGDES